MDIHKEEFNQEVKAEIESFSVNLNSRNNIEDKTADFIKYEITDSLEEVYPNNEITTEFVDCKIEVDNSDESLDCIFDEENGSASFQDIPSFDTLETKKSRGKIKKEKTEPANQYLQFLKFKKEQLEKSKPGAKLDRDTVRDEWKSLSASEKQLYKELAQKEKESLGDSYRKNRRRRIKKVHITDLIGKSPKINKKRKTKKDQSQQLKIHTKKEMTLEIFLDESECLDKEIEAAYKLKENLTDQLSKLKTELAIKDERLSVLLEYSLKSRYENLVQNPSQCSE